MEVHHHPHVEKKSFKEYLLEGLMIFLAVSMGFIAENIREHITDSKLEKEFIESIVVDLKNDQESFNKQIEFLNQRNLVADSLITLITGPKPINNTADFYFWSRQITRHNIMLITTATFDEMKFGSFFRLINKKGVSKQIVDYYNQIQVLNYFEKAVENNGDEFRSLYKQIVQPFDFIKTLDKNTARIIRLNYNPSLKNNTEVLDQMVLQANAIISLRTAMENQVKIMKNKGTSILHLIQKEYYLVKE